MSGSFKMAPIVGRYFRTSTCKKDIQIRGVVQLSQHPVGTGLKCNGNLFEKTIF